MYTFAHIGVPTDKIHIGETGSAEAKSFCTNATESPLHIEYLRFLPGCQAPKELRTKPHIAFYVENLDEAAKEMDGQVIGPMESPEFKNGFYLKDGLLLELIELNAK